MRLFVVALACLLLASLAAAQSVPDCYNGVGIFFEEYPNPVTNYVEYLGPPGELAAYVILVNPYNEHTGAPMENLGGYEFQIEVPSNVGIVPTLLGGAVNFMEPPDFYCGVDLPVVDQRVLLMTLDVFVVTEDPGYLFITPVSNINAQSIPGEIALADADDEFSLSRATPVSYDFGIPVVCMNEPCEAVLKNTADGVWGDCWVIPATENTWGDVKAMYR